METAEARAARQDRGAFLGAHALDLSDRYLLIGLEAGPVFDVDGRGLRSWLYVGTPIRARCGVNVWWMLPALAVAQVRVESPGDGARLDLRRAPVASGSTPFEFRCTWTERRWDGGFEQGSCGVEGRFDWTWSEGAWSIALDWIAPEPGCPEAASVAGARWTGRADAGGVVGEVHHTPSHAVSRAADLQAELGDALQRLIVPLPVGKIREGAAWTVHVREEASGLLGGVTQRWTATRDGLAWTEQVDLPAQTVQGRTVEPSVEQWRGALVHEPSRLLPSGRWEAERPLRVTQGSRWIETLASCTGALRR